MDLVTPKRFEVYLVSLDPTVGAEMRKTRPCVVISPDSANRNLLTVLVAPLTSRAHPFPSRVNLRFQGADGQAALDQIRVVDKRRLRKRLGRISASEAEAVTDRLVSMFMLEAGD